MYLLGTKRESELNHTFLMYILLSKTKVVSFGYNLTINMDIGDRADSLDFNLHNYGRAKIFQGINQFNWQVIFI